MTVLPSDGDFAADEATADKDAERTREQLQKRYQCLARAKESWRALSALKRVLLDHGDPAGAAVAAGQVHVLVRALGAINEQHILIELYNSNALLEPSWQALSLALRGLEPERIERALMPWMSTEYAQEVLWDLGARLANLIHNQLDLDGRLTRAITETQRCHADITDSGNAQGRLPLAQVCAVEVFPFPKFALRGA